MNAAANTVQAPAGKPGRDEDHYTYPRTGAKVTRVSTILSATISDAYLAAWYATEGGKFALDHLDELAALLALGRRDEAVALIAGAAPRITARKADTGTYIHDVIEALVLWATAPAGTGASITLPDIPDHLRGADYDGEPIEDVIAWLEDGFVAFVADWNPEFLHAEMTVFNIGLGVGGTLDIIVRIRDVAISDDGTTLVAAPGRSVILVIDVKTGRQKKRWKQQVAGYRRMTEAEPVPGELVPMPASDAVAILHLRRSYRRGYRLMVVSGREEADAWNRFRRRCEIYAGDKRDRDKPGRVVYPPLPDGTMPAPLLADLDGEVHGRILGPLLRALGDDATLADVAEFTREDLLAIDGIGPKTADAAAAMLADRGYDLAGTGKAA